MGVHPGCPVCLIVVVVAVETDVGEAIACVCGLWFIGVALLSAGPFFYL